MIGLPERKFHFFTIKDDDSRGFSRRIFLNLYRWPIPIRCRLRGHRDVEMAGWVECSSCGIRPNQERREAEFNLEIHVPTRYGGTSIEFEVDPGGEDDVSAHFTVGKLFWLSGSVSRTALSHRLARRVMEQSERSGGQYSTYSGRAGLVDWNDGRLSWSLWHPNGEWSSSTPRWRSGSWSPADTFLGKVEAEHHVIHQEDTEIPLPEGVVPAVVKIERWVRKRKRWIVKINYSGQIDPQKPAPVPGKGENSWDCGDDAIHSLSCPVGLQSENRERVAEVVAQFTKSVLRQRARYGGKNWQPATAS